MKLCVIVNISNDHLTPSSLDNNRQTSKVEVFTNIILFSKRSILFQFESINKHKQSYRKFYLEIDNKFIL